MDVWSFTKIYLDLKMLSNIKNIDLLPFCIIFSFKIIHKSKKTIQIKLTSHFIKNPKFFAENPRRSILNPRTKKPINFSQFESKKNQKFFKIITNTHTVMLLIIQQRVAIAA